MIRFDYLWRREAQAGREHGVKDRPCAIVLTSRPLKAGSRQVVVCPITHSPPASAGDAVEMPATVATHLGLDTERCWIVTREVNVFIWEQGRLPFGISPAVEGRWTFGNIPRALYNRIRDQVLHNRNRRVLDVTQREDC